MAKVDEIARSMTASAPADLEVGGGSILGGIGSGPVSLAVAIVIVTWVVLVVVLLLVGLAKASDKPSFALKGVGMILRRDPPDHVEPAPLTRERERPAECREDDGRKRSA